MAGNTTFTIWNRMGGTLKSASYYTSLYEFGNTRYRGTDSGTGNALAIGTKHMHSGKWYFEFLVDGSPAGGWPAVGIMAATDVGTGQKQGNPQMESIFSWVFATSGNLKAFKFFPNVFKSSTPLGRPVKIWVMQIVLEITLLTPQEK